MEVFFTEILAAIIISVPITIIGLFSTSLIWKIRKLNITYSKYLEKWGYTLGLLGFLFIVFVMIRTQLK
jgi:hypothetical protein